MNSRLPMFFWADSSSQPPLYLYCSSAKILFPAPTHPPIRRLSHYAPHRHSAFFWDMAVSRHRHSALFPSAAPEGACGCSLAPGSRTVASVGGACVLHPLLAAGTHRLLAWPCSVHCATVRFGMCAFRCPHATSGATSALGPSHGYLCGLGGDGSAASGVHRPELSWSRR